MGSSLHEVDFGSLAILDGGKLNAELRNRLSLVSKDCQERAGDSKGRTVTIKITLEPVTEQDGCVSGSQMYVDIESKLPPYNSQAYSAGLRRRGNQATVVFNEDSLDDVDQATLNYGDDDLDDE